MRCKLKLECIIIKREESSVTFLNEVGADSRVHFSREKECSFTTMCDHIARPIHAAVT